MKKMMKRILCLALTFVLAFSMCACGKKGGDNNGGGGFNGGGNSANGGNPNANNALAKEGVFKEKTLKIGNSTDFYIMSSKTMNGKIQILGRAYLYDEDACTGSVSIAKYVLSKDGEVEETKEIALPEYQAPEEILAKVQAIAEASAEEGESVDITKGYFSDSMYFYVNNYLNSAVLTEDGGVFAWRDCGFYYEDYLNVDESQSVENNYFTKWDADGNIVYDVAIDMSVLQSEDSYNYIQNVIGLKNGKAALMIDGDQRGFLLIDENGQMGKITKIDGMPENANSIIVKNDGTVLVTYYNDEYTKMYINTVDVENGRMGTATEIPSSIVSLGFYNTYPGVDSDLVFTNGTGLFSYNINDTEAKKLMDFINSDLATYGLNEITMIDGESFLTSYYDEMNGGRVTSLFTHVKPEDVPDKKVLVMGGLYIGYEAKNKIVRFNKTNSNYRITIKDYSVYNTEEDYTLARTQLNNDIISGNTPDIIVVSSERLPIESYVKKGLLANIDDLIAKDEELSKYEYLQNVFDAFRVDGKMYVAHPSFSVSSYAGKTSVLGNKTTISMADLKQLKNSIPEESTLYGDMTRSSFLYMVMNYAGNELVNTADGTCKFDTGYFQEVLEMARTYPEEINYDDIEWNEEYWTQYETQYRTGKVIFNNVYLSDFNNLRSLYSATFGEDISFVGFPNESGSRAVINSYDDGYAIYAKSANLDGAWEYVRQLFTEETQRNIMKNRSALPVMKSVFEEFSKDATGKYYWYDENGNKQYAEWDETYYMGGEEIPVKPLTQAQLDTVLDVIYSAKTVAFSNEDVMDIITEESKAFFTGQKSSEEVCRIIQSRVKMYINANM